MEKNGLYTKNYLARIGLKEHLPATVATLQQIQSHHIMTVPFENLDIMAGIPLSFDIDHLYNKVVERRRGGICYEVNLLLAHMLENLGYTVKRLSALSPKYGDDFDHILLVVHAEDCEWLVDVGFADNYFIPLKLECDTWQSDTRDQFKITRAHDSYSLIKLMEGTEVVKYIFTLQERQPADYKKRCDWFCTAPESQFTQGKIVALDRPHGRVSLTQNRLLITEAGKKERTEIPDEAAFAHHLQESFNIKLPQKS